MLLQHVAFLVLLVGTEAFFTGLSVLNLRHSRRKIEDRADWLETEIGMADPQRMLDYTRAREGLSGLRAWVGLGVLLLVLYSGLYAEAVAFVESFGLSPVASGVVFFLGAFVVGQVASLPFSVASTFVVEEIFDFNRQSVRLWARDQVVSLGIGIVIVGVLSGAVLAVIERFPSWWWLGVLAVFAAFSLVMQVLLPRVVMPLFYDFDPVDSGDLRDAVEDVFDRAGFSCSEIYVMDASRRSSKSNAFFMGFGRTKRVALFDTLVDRMDLPEIQSVLAHELAHWKRAHVWKRMAAGVVRMGLLLVVLQYLVDAAWLYEMFGVPSTTYAGLLLGGLWLAPVGRWIAPLENRLSLAHEYEADAFAREVMGDPEPLVNGLHRLVSENLSNPFPHPVYEAFHYDHPPLPERVRHVRDEGDETA